MTEPAHILVVDDDASIRRMLQILLSDAGYRVSTAASGEEALAYVDLVTPDLILLDLMLPGINGRQVAERIKSNPQRPFIPIILVTARSDSRSKVSGLDAGADDYLAKPVEFAELLARVRALLRLQRAQRSLHAEQRKTELLLHLTRELSTTLDLDELLTHFLERLADAIGAVRASIIMTLGDQTRFFSSSRFATTVALHDILASGTAGWVLREKQPLVIGDTSQDARWVASDGSHGTIQSVIAVPVLRDGRALGVITVVHHTPNHFSDEHLDLLTSVAQQSAFTLENAELFRLTRSQKELLEQRTDELQRLNEVSHHLSELMQPDLLLRLVAHLVHYTFGYPQVSIFLRDGEGARIKAVAGALDSESHLETFVPAGRGLVNWVIQHREALCIGIVREDKRYFSALPPEQDARRSELMVPIVAGREIYGALGVSSDAVQAFSANDTRLLGTLASQIGVALDNARLFESEKRRVRQLGQVNDLSLAITAQLDRAQNLQIAADALTMIFGVERSAIIAFDDGQQRGKWVLSSKVRLHQSQQIIDALNLTRSVVGIQQPEIVANVGNDQRFAPLHQALETYQVHALALAPLISGGHQIGTVALDISSRVGQFGSPELTLLATVASLIGQVVENTRLYREVEDERRTINAVLDGAADPILLIDPQERLLLSNRAATTRLQIPIGSTAQIDTLIHQPDLLGALRMPTNGSGPREITLDDLTTFAISISPVVSGADEPIGRVAVMQDITAIKELERREQERLRGVLRRYVSPQVVEQVLAGGSDFGSPVERNVVVLFADLRGYTALTEGIDARVLVEQVLNRYFTAMTEVLYRHEGTIDKFLGDGIIGVFGTPIAHPDDLQRGLLAAVDLQRAFDVLRVEWQQQLGLDIGMGIGVGYGPAIVGNIGSTQRTDFTLIGDVVNTTSRLNGIALAGQIIVSHQLIDMLPATWNAPFALREIGRVPLKGKQDPHLIFEVDYSRDIPLKAETCA